MEEELLESSSLRALVEWAVLAASALGQPCCRGLIVMVNLLQRNEDLRVT